MKKMFKIKYPKFQIEFMKLFDKDDWHINVLPYFNFGNNEWNKKSCVINIGWIIWNIYIYISWGGKN